MRASANAQTIRTWLRKAKMDLHYLSVHLEEHGNKATAARVAGNTKAAKYEEEIVEMYYRRIKELRTVIADQESKLSNIH